jgi:hypothetical protein
MAEAQPPSVISDIPSLLGLALWEPNILKARGRMRRGKIDADFAEVIRRGDRL